MYKFVKAFSRTEFERAWYPKQPNKELRQGQAFWNTFGKEGESFPELFYETNNQRAKYIAWNHIEIHNQNTDNLNYTPTSD